MMMMMIADNICPPFSSTWIYTNDLHKNSQLHFAVGQAVAISPPATIRSTHLKSWPCVTNVQNVSSQSTMTCELLQAQGLKSRWKCVTCGPTIYLKPCVWSEMERWGIVTRLVGARRCCCSGLCRRLLRVRSLSSSQTGQRVGKKDMQFAVADMSFPEG